MFRKAVAWPVVATSRTMFPQTSAFRALSGLRVGYGVGQIALVPAATAIPSEHYPPPAFASLESGSASRYARISSRVKHCWDRIGVWLAPNSICCSRKTEEG
jgi:hypothetical protein